MFINMFVLCVGHSVELFVGSGCVFVVGGIGSLGSVVQMVEIYDFGINVFVVVGSMMSFRVYAMVTCLDDACVFVVGGTNGVGFYYKMVDVFVLSFIGDVSSIDCMVFDICDVVGVC
jgi:hypothetical protein